MWIDQQALGEILVDMEMVKDFFLGGAANMELTYICVEGLLWETMVGHCKENVAINTSLKVMLALLDSYKIADKGEKKIHHNIDAHDVCVCVYAAT